MPQPGHATREGTTAYAARFAGRVDPAAFGPLGSTGLTVSRFGFGGYRVDDRTPEHREALERALLSGSNVIDTSANYADGSSERLIGLVLHDLVGRSRLRREEVVVVSKIGYVQGSNLALARQREAEGRPFPEMVKYTEACWHCIHPEYLEDQLDRLLGRLGLSILDVCLLHNPEYFLLDAKQRGAGSRSPLHDELPAGSTCGSAGDLLACRDEYYRRLREAFRYLEGAVAAGRIRWYGVSSNTVARPADDPEATSLIRMLEAAREAGGAEHHFRILQLPLNLFESDGFFERNSEGATVLELAARERLGVLTNRPLNAIVENELVRLADIPIPSAEVSVDEQLSVVGALEEEWRREIAGAMPVPPQSIPPADYFRWSEELAGIEPRVKSLEHWLQIEEQVIVPDVNRILLSVERNLPADLVPRWRRWRARYLPELQRLLAECRRLAALKSQALALAVTAVLDPHLPPERRGESLSRKALWVVASTPGVSTVLVGMRRRSYVDDALGVLRWPPLPDVRAVYTAVRTLELPRLQRGNRPGSRAAGPQAGGHARRPGPGVGWVRARPGPGAPASREEAAMTFTSELWQSIEPIYGAILRHPFIAGLTDGSLPRESFRFYAVQDALYLREFARALSIAAARAPQDDWIIMFNEHAAGALRVERALHESFFKEWGLSPEDVAATPPAPTNLAYTSYLLATAYGAPFYEGLAALLPCYWIYWEVGKALERAGSPDPLYTRWIGTYASQEFGSLVQAVLEAAVQIAAGLTPEQRDAMRRHFVTTSRYEWMFWDMGYRREAWPV